MVNPPGASGLCSFACVFHGSSYHWGLIFQKYVHRERENMRSAMAEKENTGYAVLGLWTFMPTGMPLALSSASSV